MRLGVLDIGSNTVHMLICDIREGSAPLPALSVKKPMRLIEHLDKQGAFLPSMTSDLIQTIQELTAQAEAQGCSEILAFATSAIRDASNGEELLAEVFKQTKQRIDVLSGAEEAKLTFLATRRWFGWSSGVLLVLDIGGGSFEIAVGTGEQPDVAISLPLGAGRLTRDFNLSDPPTSKEVKELQKYVRQEIANVVSEVSKPGLADHVVGTSKTFRSLARIAGAAPSSEGPRERRFLWDTDLREITDELVGMSRKERTNLPGVSASRAEQLAAGAIVASTAVDLLNVEVVEIGPWALREGILLKHIDGMHR